MSAGGDNPLYGTNIRSIGLLRRDMCSGLNGVVGGDLSAVNWTVSGGSAASGVAAAFPLEVPVSESACVDEGEAMSWTWENSRRDSQSVQLGMTNSARTT